MMYICYGANAHKIVQFHNFVRLDIIEIAIMNYEL